MKLNVEVYRMKKIQKTKTKKNFLNKKAFIGPVGDDLPSLIPIMFGLIIFFSVFNHTWMLYNEKDKEFQFGLDIERISSGIKKNSYFSTVSDFKQKCEEASFITLNSKFEIAIIQNKFTSPLEEIDIYDLENIAFDLKSIDSSYPGETKYYYTNSEDKLTIKTQNVQLRIFPVALEIKNSDNKFQYVEPMYLVIVIWRN